MDFVVEVAGVRKSFGPIQALRGVDLQVQAGETYGLLGPNGSGKTTLIRAIAGLLRSESGDIQVLGTRMPSREILSQVGYMTQASALYLDLTVQENLEFFATIYGVHSKERVSEVLGLVELTDRASSLAGTLSGGMRQRLSLACALVHKPSLLLLDEPTVGIDPQLRASFWNHFRQLNQDGVTILLSSHVMDEAERCDRLGMMMDGLLIAEGTPAELKQKTGQANLEQAFLLYAGGAR